MSGYEQIKKKYKEYKEYKENTMESIKTNILKIFKEEYEKYKNEFNNKCYENKIVIYIYYDYNKDIVNNTLYDFLKEDGWPYDKAKITYDSRVNKFRVELNLE
jgi:hypothetical protein